MIESLPSSGFKVIDLPEELLSLVQRLILNTLLPTHSYKLSNSFLTDLPNLLLNLDISSRSLRTIPPDIVSSHSRFILGSKVTSLVSLCPIK